MARIGFAVLAIGACLLLMQAAARIGFSRLLARYAIATNSVPAADQAIQLTPADPTAHRARATVLNRLRMPSEAEASLERATSLRYRDDYLWLELGNTREELGDISGALAAFDEAVRWAPYYAHTHWQRGNLLLRMGCYDDAFADLREAARSNRKFMPALIDLAWGLTGGAVNGTETLVQINDDNDRLAFARLLARKGRGNEVVRQLDFLTAPLSVENRRKLVSLLFAAKAFRDAFELQRELVPLPRDCVFNGGFEEPLAVNNAGFGWIVSSGREQTKLAIDVSEKFSGAKSLQIGFEGEWSAGTSLLSQTVVIEEGQRYRLSFAVYTKELVTGGPVVITVSDAARSQLLAKTEPFPQATNSWQSMHVEFETLPASQAVVIRLERQSCASSPCPILGVVWLDEFSLQKL